MLCTEKNTDMASVKLALAELRCTTCGFETVLHSFARLRTVDITGFLRPSSKVAPYFNSQNGAENEFI